MKLLRLLWHVTSWRLCPKSAYVLHFNADHISRSEAAKLQSALSHAGVKCYVVMAGSTDPIWIKKANERSTSKWF